MRVTLAKITRALEARGIAAEIVRGDGYFYFVGDDAPTRVSSSVLTNRLGPWSVREWVREFAQLAADESRARGEERGERFSAIAFRARFTLP